MIQAYKDFWKNYVNFKDRATRPQFWWAYLANVIINAILWVLFVIATIFVVANALVQNNLTGSESPNIVYSAVGDAALASPLFIIILLLVTLYELATLLPNISIIVRRLRDAGIHPAWAFLIGVGFVISIFPIPVIGIIIRLGAWIAIKVLMAQPTKNENNQYAHDIDQKKTISTVSQSTKKNDTSSTPKSATNLSAKASTSANVKTTTSRIKKPTEENTIAEIKSYLDQKNIAYKNRSTKSELLKLIK